MEGSERREPVSECDEHTAIYGKFGIGFKKSYVKRLGGNPARYYVNHMPPINEARGLLSVNLGNHISVCMGLRDLLKKDDTLAFYDHQGAVLFTNEKLKEWLGQQVMILSYEKETGDLGPAFDDTRRDDPYYREREWRIVPYQRNIDNKTINLEEKDKFYYASFDRQDVNVIVTPNEEIRTDVLTYMLKFEKGTDARLKKFAENPPPVVTYDDLHKW